MFKAWPKTARFDSAYDITEKIDGTNACINILPRTDDVDEHTLCTCNIYGTTKLVTVTAQSRTRLITPENDNHGFARWVKENAESLVDDLGVGRHYGEWFGSGIQRAYGYKNGEKWFALFDAKHWYELQKDGSQLANANFQTPNLCVVPVLSHGESFDVTVLHDCVIDLINEGSLVANEKFDRAEGVVVRWWHDNTSKKYIIDK